VLVVFVGCVFDFGSALSVRSQLSSISYIRLFNESLLFAFGVVICVLTSHSVIVLVAVNGFGMNDCVGVCESDREREREVKMWIFTPLELVRSHDFDKHSIL